MGALDLELMTIKQIMNAVSLLGILLCILIPAAAVIFIIHTIKMRKKSRKLKKNTNKGIEFSSSEEEFKQLALEFNELNRNGECKQ